jgi:hypothetical protein
MPISFDTAAFAAAERTDTRAEIKLVSTGSKE